MIPHRDKIYILNPCYKFRNDIHRIVLFSKIAVSENRSSQEWHTFIHPAQASMFSFFTYNRRYEENLRLLSDFFSKDISYMDRALSAYVANSAPVYTLWKGHKICFPKNMLIEYDKPASENCFPEWPAESFSCTDIDLKTRRLHTGPLLLTFMLTNRCRTHCQYCYADTFTHYNQPLPTSRILEIIHEAAAINVRQINLMGGEIFLHNDWDIILKELVRLDIAPEFISTKIPLSEKDIDKLKATGFTHVIQVSLDCCNDTLLMETLHVNSDYKDEMLRSIRLLDQSGLKYQIASVLTSKNCKPDVMKELFGFLSSLEHIRDWRIIPVSNSITINYEKFSGLKPLKVEVESLFCYMEEYLIPHSHFPILLNRDAINKEYYTTKGGSMHFNGALCSALNTHMFVLPDGKVTICEQLYRNPRFIIGDLTDTGIREVWNSPQALKLVNLSQLDIRKESPCRNCQGFEQCFNYQNRCWSDIIKAYGKECWDFPDPRCSLAPTMKNNLGYE